MTGKRILVVDDDAKNVELVKAYLNRDGYKVTAAYDGGEALRLATIEWRIDNHESIPFIADDILVNFDDDRSKATLKALANLAKKNQVLLFTHHKAVVILGKNLRQDNNVVIHDLTKVS